MKTAPGAMFVVSLRLPRWGMAYVETLRIAEDAGATIDFERALERILEGVEVVFDDDARY